MVDQYKREDFENEAAYNEYLKAIGKYQEEAAISPSYEKAEEVLKNALRDFAAQSSATLDKDAYEREVQALAATAYEEARKG